MSLDFVLLIAFIIGMIIIHNTIDTAPTISDMLKIFGWYILKFVLLMLPSLIVDEIHIFWNLQRDLTKVIPNTPIPMIITLLFAWIFSLNYIIAILSGFIWILLGFLNLNTNQRSHGIFCIFELNILSWILLDNDINSVRGWALSTESVFYQEIIRNNGKIDLIIFRMFITTLVSKLFAFNEQYSIIYILIYFYIPPFIGYIIYKLYNHKQTVFISVLITHFIFWYFVTILQG